MRGAWRYNIFYLYRNSIEKMFVQIANMYTGRSENVSVNPPIPLTVSRDGRHRQMVRRCLSRAFVLNGYQFCCRVAVGRGGKHPV